MELLQLWHQVYQEAVRFSVAIASLPEACECGDAEAHLAGRCRCCVHRSSPPHGASENCAASIERLRADISILCQDFSSVAGPLEEAALQTQQLELRRGVFLAASDLQRIVAALEQVSAAIVGFRSSCSLTEMQRIKRYTALLRQHCDQLNAQL